MAKKILAIYSDGALNPIVPLDLPEHVMVRLTVEVVPQATNGEPTIVPPSPRLSRSEWLKKVRKRKAASKTRITAEEILEARDADRK